MNDKDLKEMRWMSNYTGLVYEAQVEQLKILANLCFNPSVAVISISEQNRTVTCDSTGPANDRTQKFPNIVKTLLGDNWEVKVCYNVRNDDTGKSRKTARRSKPKGKGRTGATPKRRRGSARSKN